MPKIIEKNETENKNIKLLEVINLKKHYTKHKNIIEEILKKNKIIKAVDGVSFSVDKNEVFAVIGESGSGKTTLAKLLMKLTHTTEGKVFFEGVDTTNIESDKLKEYKKNVQMIFQDPYASMNPRFRIKDVLKEPLIINKINEDNLSYDQMVIKALNDVKITPAEEFMERYPHMLSGGQRQRVAIARSFILKPKLLIADEPVSMIDLSTRAEILHTMKELQEKHELSYIYITHDLSTAKYFADKIAVMYLGKIVEIASSNEIIESPLHPYTRALIASVPEPVSGKVDTIKKLPIFGDIPYGGNIPSGCRFHTRCIYAKEECKNTEPELKNISDNHLVACLYSGLI